MKLLLLVAVLAAAPMHYEPEVSTLTGTVKNDKVFYGPPTFGQDKEHDERETPFRLVLDAPVSIEPLKPDKFNEPVKDVKEITLVPGKVKDLQRFLDLRVTAKGKLFAAHTAHHHTPALIDLESLELVPRDAK